MATSPLSSGLSSELRSRGSGRAAQRAAADAAAAAEDILLVARARLAEAVATAPRVSPRVAGAEDEVARAHAAAQKAAQGVVTRQHALEDAQGALEAAQAVYDDISDQVVEQVVDEARTPAAGGPRKVAARVRLDKRLRAVAAAQAAVVDASEAQAGAEGALAAAEDHLAAARGLTPDEPAKVVAARAAVAAAERAVTAAHEDAAAARESAATGEHDTSQAGLQGLEGLTAGARPEFASLDAFVEDYVLANWRHRPTTARWCATWWRHAEAITRLEACWRAWEVMRLEPAPALSTWWRDHLDVHMRALTDLDGTFAGCVATRHDTHHTQQDLWQTQAAPADVFPVDPDSPRQPARLTSSVTNSAFRNGVGGRG